MDSLKSLLAALPSAASSPYAFVAYISVLVGWVIIALKVKRNAQLLAHIDKLPPKDRLVALQLEMGTVNIKEDMTPEQWLRARVHSYLFFGFSILCLAAVVIFVVAYSVRKPGKVDVDITPYSNSSIPRVDAKTPLSTNPAESTQSPGPAEPSAPSNRTRRARSMEPTAISFRKGGSDKLVDNQFDDSSGSRIYPSEPDFTLTYDYDRVDGKIIVTPKMPYLLMLSKGGPISGIDYWWSAFAWQFPKLSIKIVNNTDRTLELTEAAIGVTESTINTDPVIVIQEDKYNIGHFAIVNEGWGRVINPTFDVGVERQSACNTFPSDTPNIHVTRSTFDEGDNVPIIQDVPPSLRSEKAVCVFGEMQFTTESAVKRSLKFDTLVSLVKPGPGAPAPPDYLYDVFLRAGEAGYTKRIPISEEVKPGEVDHFLIRIGTDKSASFNLTFSFVSRPASSLSPTQVRLSVFVPRSQVGASRLSSSR
jgi:hypothetical protein